MLDRHTLELDLTICDDYDLRQQVRGRYSTMWAAYQSELVMLLRDKSNDDDHRIDEVLVWGDLLTTEVPTEQQVQFLQRCWRRFVDLAEARYQEVAEVRNVLKSGTLDADTSTEEQLEFVCDEPWQYGGTQHHDIPLAYLWDPDWRATERRAREQRIAASSAYAQQQEREKKLREIRDLYTLAGELGYEVTKKEEAP